MAFLNICQMHVKLGYRDCQTISRGGRNIVKLQGLKYFFPPLALCPKQSTCPFSNLKFCAYILLGNAHNAKIKEHNVFSQEFAGFNFLANYHIFNKKKIDIY